MSNSGIKIKIYTQMKEATLQNYAKKSNRSYEHSNIFSSNGPDFIFVKDKEMYRKVFLDNILFIKADGVYSEVHTVEHRFLASNCLGKVLKQLNNEDIIRCHRSYAVNIKRVDAFWESQLVVGENKIEVPVGLKFKNDIFHRFPILRSQ